MRLSFKNVGDVQDLDYRVVPMPEWGEDAEVELGTISAQDMIEWTEANADPTKRREAGVRLLAKSMVERDEDGSNPRRAEGENLDALMGALRARRAASVFKLVNAVLELNNMLDAQVSAAKNA